MDLNGARFNPLCACVFEKTVENLSINLSVNPVYSQAGPANVAARGRNGSTQVLHHAQGSQLEVYNFQSPGEVTAGKIWL